MSQLNIADVEDAYLNADLFEEWQEEYEKAFYKPLNDMVLMDLASKMSDAEIEQLKKQDPIAWTELMEAKEKMDNYQEQKAEEAEKRGV